MAVLWDESGHYPHNRHAWHVRKRRNLLWWAIGFFALGILCALKLIGLF